jgi:ABC-type nitrate/sulfonate/bicarbonate transport system substrate-binding protein
MNKTKFFTLVLLAAVLALPPSTSAQDGEQNRPDPLAGATEFARLSERTSVKLMLDWTANTNHTGFFVAQRLGYYDEANLDVQILEPTDLLPEAALEAGVVDFGVSFQEFATIRMVEGVELVSLAAIVQNNTSGFVALAAKHPVSRPADLAGLTYGGFSFPDLENAMLNTLLACDGATWDESHYLDIGFTDAIELMQHDRIDFAWIFYGWQGINAEVNGIELSMVMLKDYETCIPNYYTPILVTSRRVIEEKPEVVHAFVQATARGYAQAILNPIEAAAVLLEAVPELDEELVQASAAWLANEYQATAPRWGQQEAEIWQRLADFLYENGIIVTPLDTAKVFTNEFLPGTVEPE